MARLNTHPSATPQAPPGRSSTVDSLYRDPTPLSQRRTNGARTSSYSVMSPARSGTSDKENNTPDSRENTPKPAARGKKPMAQPGTRLLTPPSGASSVQNGNKRRRTGDYDMGESTEIYEDDDGEVEADGDATLEDNGEDDDEDTKYYDPQQPQDLRRQVRVGIRNNHREMEDNRDELIKPGNDGLVNHIRKADYLMGKVRQTADAALDSRSLVTVSDLAGKKLNNALHGNNGVGIDVDQFVSRCIQFMNTGGNVGVAENDAPMRSRRAGRAAVHGDDEDDEEDDDTGDALDWALLGREACFGFNKRPPVSNFLLGPLSVQKRVRVTQARRARSQRQPAGPATRPQELTQNDIKQSENSNLTHLVKAIKTRLEGHIQESQTKVEDELEELMKEVGEPSEVDVEVALKRHRVQQDPEGEAAVNLFEFVINPHSFGQTVENMFYVSFLIREGNVKVTEDKDGFPILVPSQPHSIQEQREHNVQKHQAVFSLDWPTWKSFIEAYDIKEPLIPHRVPEETNVSGSGWYG